MAVIAAIATLATVGLPIVGSMFGSSDGLTVDSSAGPVTDGAAGGPMVTWTMGGFAFDTPEGWTADAGYQPGVVMLTSDDGGFVELRTGDHWSGLGDPVDHAFTVALDLYEQTIGVESEGVSGGTLDLPQADTSVMLTGAGGDVAVMIGADGTTWAAVRYSGDGADVEAAWQDTILPSVRPAA